MGYRVRGYPHLVTARPQGTAAQLGAGRIDVADEDPRTLSALELVGERLHKVITIVSGYRTDAYSQQVGGFAGDPHTRGIADDAEIDGKPIGLFPGIGRLLRQAGLISGNQPGFYKGKPDPGHVQLAAGGGSSSSTGGTTLEQLWIGAGGSPKVARIMAAIALAESGGREDVKHTNSDGTIDRGLWQINSSHSQFDPDRLLTDSSYNARAAVAVYKSQGFGAWTTYTSGEYRNYLARARTATPGVPGVSVPRTRPGGDAPSTDDAALASWKEWVTPDPPPGGWELWNPLKPFEQASSAVSDVGSFFKWVAWIFHPRNLLRIVEFTAGAGMLGFGLWTSVQAYKSSGSSSSSSSSGRRKTSVVTRAFRVTPAGRAVAVKKAARAGRSQAREAGRVAERREVQSKARRREETKLSNRRQEKRARATPASEIPF